MGLNVSEFGRGLQDNDEKGNTNKDPLTGSYFSVTQHLEGRNTQEFENQPESKSNREYQVPRFTQNYSPGQTESEM